MLPNGTSVYTFNYRGQLIATTQGERTEHYHYDPVGNLRRITRRHAQQDTVIATYTYDGNNQRIQETDANGNEARQYNANQQVT